MGRSAKVPVRTDRGNKLVKVSKIGTDSMTTYHPEDVAWGVLDRLGFDGELPSFADEGGR